MKWKHPLNQLKPTQNQPKTNPKPTKHPSGWLGTSGEVIPNPPPPQSPRARDPNSRAQPGLDFSASYWRSGLVSRLPAHFSNQNEKCKSNPPIQTSDSPPKHQGPYWPEPGSWSLDPKPPHMVQGCRTKLAAPRLRPRSHLGSNPFNGSPQKPQTNPEFRFRSRVTPTTIRPPHRRSCQVFFVNRLNGTTRLDQPQAFCEPELLDPCGWA